MSMKQNQRIGMMMSTNNVFPGDLLFVTKTTQLLLKTENWRRPGADLLEFLIQDDVMICIQPSSQFGTCKVLTRLGMSWIFI